MADPRRGAAAALALGAALGLTTAVLGATPAPQPQFARRLPEVSPEAAAIANAGGREVSTGDGDEDATLAAQADAEDHGILAIKQHEAALRLVLADMPDPFVRRSEAAGAVTYRGDSMADCLAFAATLPPLQGRKPAFLCKGNPYPAAAFYLGAYYNEVGLPDQAIQALDLGLVAGPNAPLLIAERDAALIALHRWDDVLAGAARGLAIANLSPQDQALMLRNRGFALTELRRLNEAKQAYEQSLTLAPDNALARNELAYIAKLKAGAPAAPAAIFMPNRPKSN
jgi:tetratricopeptide (TPR) repeat protein